ncbi:hypothetical protein BGZ60DRAFT_415134 [Tricladium varicosporioides]|nr:hypothetical protein BGZ60DRAFT_415134 [Hymenoscyphus varicosporioides]
MSLLLLPIELLTRIAQETLPDGFESFALTCRVTYCVSESLIKFHNRLNRQYRNLTLPKNYGTEDDLEDGTPTCSLQVLARIAEEPLIAKYILSANLMNESSPDFHTEIDRDRFLEDQLQEIKKSATPILQLLKSLPYLEDTNIDPNDMLDYLFYEYNNSGGAGMSVTILLSLLPYVTKISLPSRWKFYENGVLERPGEVAISYDRDLWLKDIVQRANDPLQPYAGLSQLTTILPTAGWGYEAHCGLDTFNHFLSIKSVQKFVMGGSKALEDSYTGQTFIEPEEGSSFGAGLEEVQLAGACADGTELRKFLKWMWKLKSFKFSFETKWHGCGHDWNKATAMAAIEDTTSETLEDLSFSIIECYGWTGPGIASMKKFKKLKRLELHLKCLTGLPYELDDTIGEYKADYDNVKFPKLGDLLPSSIEELVLWERTMLDDRGVIGGNLFPRLFENFSKEGPQKLPHLKKIVIVGGWAHNNRGKESSDLTEEFFNRGSSEFPNFETLVELAAMRKEIDIQLLVIGSSITYPRFMDGFCERYGVRNL